MVNLELELGQIIDQLRVQKNVSVQQLTEGIISKATYSRFVNQKTMVNAESLIMMLTRLNMSFAIFLQDYLDFFQLKHDYNKAIDSIVAGDEDLMEQLYLAYSQREDLTPPEAIFLDALEACAGADSAKSKEALKRLQVHFLSRFYWSEHDYLALSIVFPCLRWPQLKYILDSLVSLLDEIPPQYQSAALVSCLKAIYYDYLSRGQVDVEAELYLMFQHCFIRSNYLDQIMSEQVIDCLHEIITKEEANSECLNKLEAACLLNQAMGLDFEVDRIQGAYEGVRRSVEAPLAELKIGEWD